MAQDDETKGSWVVTSDLATSRKRGCDFKDRGRHGGRLDSLRILLNITRMGCPCRLITSVRCMKTVHGRTLCRRKSLVTENDCAVIVAVSNHAANCLIDSPGLNGDRRVCFS